MKEKTKSAFLHKSAKGSTASLRRRTMKSEPLEGKFKSTKKDSGFHLPSFLNLDWSLTTIKEELVQ